MPLYSCKTCEFTSKLRANYKRHLKTKKHIENIKLITNSGAEHLRDHCFNSHKFNEPKMIQNEPNEPKMNQNEPKKNKLKKYKCNYCGTKFKTKPSMRRHIKHRCKDIINNNTDYKINIIRKQLAKERKQFEKEKNKLYRQIEMLIEKAGDTTITNNNIMLNNFGDEDTSYITDNLMDKLLMSPGTMLPNLMKLIHFHDDHPENKNLRITNKRSKYMKVFKGDEWKLDKKEIVIDNILDTQYEVLEGYYGEKGMQKLNKDHKKRFETYIESIENEDEETIRNVKDLIELTIVNNS